MAFRVGQKVVCINDEVKPLRALPYPLKKDWDLDGLTKGAVYTVRFVGEYRGAPVLYLREIHRRVCSSWGEPGFDTLRFRPAVEPKAETDISVFLEMLNSAPKKATEREPA